MGPVPSLPFLRPAAWGETGCQRRRQMESGGMSQSRSSPCPPARRAVRGRSAGPERAGSGTPAPGRVAAAAGGGSTAAALTWRTALRASGDGAGAGAGHRAERCGGAAGPLLPQSPGRGRAAGPPVPRAAGARRPP